MSEEERESWGKKVSSHGRTSDESGGRISKASLRDGSIRVGAEEVSEQLWHVHVLAKPALLLRTTSNLAFV